MPPKSKEHKSIVRDKINTRINSKTSSIILEMLSGFEDHLWEEYWINCRKGTNILEQIEGDFTDLFTILLNAKDKAFPSHYNRATAMAHLGQIYLFMVGYVQKHTNIEKRE